MKKTMELRHPIMINNSQVTSLDYDVDEITVRLFCEAEAAKMAAAGRRVSSAVAAETDFSLHIYLFFAAVIAINPQYDFSDLERLKGGDAMEAMAIGRGFIVLSGRSRGEISGEQSEPTPEPTTPQSQTSKDKD